MAFNGVFTGKLHYDHRTPLCGFSDDFRNSKFWHQMWKLLVTSQCPSRLSNWLPPKNVASLKQQSCQVSCHLENSSRLCDLCGRKNTYFWPSWKTLHFRWIRDQSTSSLYWLKSINSYLEYWPTILHSLF